MDSFEMKLDLNKYSEFKKIKSIIDEIVNWGHINYRIISKGELYKKVWENINYIEEQASEEEKEILNKIINNENLEDEYLKNINYEVRKNILNYAYWRYKNINEKKIKIDLTNLKKRLDIYSNYRKEIEVDGDCYSCKGKGKLIIKEYEKCFNPDFICKTCNHTVKKTKNQREFFIFNCECKVCKEKVYRFYKILNENLNNLIINIIDDVETKLKKEVSANISDEKMFYDWIKNKDTIEDELKKFLSFDIQSNENLVLKLRKIDFYEKSVQVFNEMIDKKVIYISIKLDKNNLFRFLLNNRAIMNQYIYHINSKFDKKSDNSLNIDNDIKLYNNSYNLIYGDEEIFISFDKSYIKFLLYYDENNMKMDINKYFFENIRIDSSDNHDYYKNYKETIESLKIIKENIMDIKEYIKKCEMKINEQKYEIAELIKVNNRILNKLNDFEQMKEVVKLNCYDISKLKVLNKRDINK